MSSSSFATGAERVDVVDLHQLHILLDFRYYRFDDFLKRRLTQSGRVVASDFDYNSFRTEVFSKAGIPIEFPLYPPPGSGVINIINEATAIIALTQIQGSPLIKLEKYDGESPLLRLSHNAPPRTTPPTLNDGLRTPFTPRTRRPVQHEDVEDLSFSTDGGYDENERGETEDRDNAEEQGENDDDYGDGTASNNVVIRELGYDWAVVEPATYDECCRWFSCDPQKKDKITLAGIKVEIERYQAYAIYKAFSQVTRGIYSFMVGDDVGLGKTSMTLIMATIYSMIFNMQQQVLEQPNQHLPDDLDSQSLSQCPTQRNNMVQCPCVKNSLSRTLVDRLSDLATLVVAPPGSIPTWFRDAQELIDSSTMSIHVAHSSFEKHEAYLSESKVPEIMSQADTISSGLSRNIVLISQNGVKKFLRRFGGTFDATITKIKYTSISAGDNGKYSLSAGLMVFDEFHRYAGSAAQLTHPFKMLQHLSRNKPDNRPTLAIGVSGSSRADCAHWRPFVKHAFEMDQKYRPIIAATGQRAEPLEIAKLQKVEDMDKFITSWRILVDRLNDPGAEGEVLVRLETRQRALFSFLREFIPQMIISRRRGDDFLGEKIQASQKVELVDCRMHWRAEEELTKTFSAVKSWLGHEYRNAIEKWRKNGEQGEKPTKQEIAQRRLEAISDRQKATTVHSKDFQIASRATTFPTIARLINSNTIPYTSLLGKNIRPIATKISNLLPPRPRTQHENERVMEVFRSSPFWDSDLYEESTKYQYVESELNQLVNMRMAPADEPDFASYGVPPPDGTNIRHAIVFSDNQFTAFLLAMMIFETYHDQHVDVLYAHGGVNMQTRQSYANYIQKPCQPGDNIKVLVSSIDIMGYGFELFRANTVILTEIPRRLERQTQAFGRVDRRGQVMKTRLIQLHDSRNLCEEVRRIRNDNREGILNLANVFSINDDDDDDDEQPDSSRAV
ncbi:hypothetical protein GGR51DRAFT_572156 [Nemania sp. FL0031]|nr:hypothetical protein GGR51DRAFT_572156 [Nemania sp. FL0031]